MLNACKIMTAAALLLHSIFGCSLHHACACESHAHGKRQLADAWIESTMPDHGDLGPQHDSSCCDCHHETSHDQLGSEASLTAGCDCRQDSGRSDGDSPCCSEIQCSFTLASSSECSLDVRLVLLNVVDVDSFLAHSPRAIRPSPSGRLGVGFDCALTLCALHCSWQI